MPDTKISGMRFLYIFFEIVFSDKIKDFFMRKVKMTPLFFLIVLLMLAFSPCAASSENLYIGNPSDFQNALKKGESVIYVDDVYFEKETQITLNYNVKIVGKTNKSRIKNACFTVVGSNVDGKNISVSFENIILDGNIDKKNYKMFY